MRGKVGHFSLNVAGFYLWVCGCVMIVVAQIMLVTLNSYQSFFFRIQAEEI